MRPTSITTTINSSRSSRSSEIEKQPTNAAGLCRCLGDYRTSGVQTIKVLSLCRLIETHGGDGVGKTMWISRLMMRYDQSDWV